jgi:hypothetical protein
MRTDHLARPSLVVILLVALGTATAIAESRVEKPKPPPPADTEKKAKDDESAAKPRYDVKKDDVITNEDLERMMDDMSPMEARTGVYQAKAEPAKPAPAPGAPGDPAAKPPAGKPAPKSQQVTDAEGKVATLQARVSELEKAVLAVKNPLLPRTWATPDSMKDQDQESGFEALDNTGRLSQRESELRAAREELSKARADLAELHGGAADEP